MATIGLKTIVQVRCTFQMVSHGTASCLVAYLMVVNLFRSILMSEA